MALKQRKIVNVQPIGEVEMDTYIQVIHVSGTKDKTACNVRFRKDSSTGGIVKDMAFQFTPDMNGPNFIKQAYLHLKTLPEFSNAEDC
jgi:hypothetical protein